MKRGLLLLAFTFLALDCWGNACSSAATGNWNAAGTWTSCGGVVPGAGDTFAINNTHTVTVNDSETFGTSGATGTLDGTINSGGTLDVQAAGTLNARGGITLQQGGTFKLEGTLNWNPPDGSTYKMIVGAGGSGNATFTIDGASTSSEAIVKLTPQGTTGLYFLLDGTTNHSPIISISNAQVKGCGTASQYCIRSDIASSGQNISVTNSQFISSGVVFLGLINGAVNFTMDKVDVRSCLDTSQGNGDCLRLQGTVANTTGSRLLTNVTSWNSTYKYIDLLMEDLKVGKSIAAGDATDVPGIYAYRTQISSQSSFSLRNTFDHLFVANDQAANGDSGDVVLESMSASVVQDSILYVHYVNQHDFVDGLTGNALASNIYRRTICDGDGFWNTDAGDMMNGAATTTFQYSLDINSCGTTWTLANSGQSLIMQNLTTYKSFGGSIGETTGAAGQVQSYTNSLMVLPSTQEGANQPDNDGLHQRTAFIRQSSFTMDFNGFWQMPGSGDSGANAANVPTLLTNSSLGILGYMFFPQAVVGSQSGKSATAGSDTTHVVCTGCNFTQSGELGVQVGDFVIDTGSNLYAQVSVITDATHLTLASAISGFTSGRTFDVRKDYWNTSGAQYGDNNRGQHDIHANPNFRDPTRTIATWDTANGGPGTIADVGLQIVKLNGFDSTGTATTFNSAFDITQAISYIDYGFTPTNTAYKGAGVGGVDIGALPVVNAFAPTVGAFEPGP